MKKQPERTAKTRQSIINAFWGLYREKKIEKITIKEITDSAGVYRSTFYEYFSDIYEVLAVIEDDIMEDFHAFWGRFYQSPDFEAGIKYVLSFYEAHGERLAVLLGPNGDQGFYLRIKDSAKEFLLANMSADKSDHRIELLLTALSSTILSLLQYWYEHRDSITLRETLAAGNQFLANGVLPTLKDLGIPLLK